MNDISLLLLQLYQQMAFPPSHSTIFMFHSHEDQDPLPSTSLNSFPSLPPPRHFISQTHTPSLFLKMGSHQFLNDKFLGGEPFMLKRSMSFSGMDNKCDEFHGEGGSLDDGLQLGEKKKRLNMEQVKALEKSFESGNKLEPERKVQLAKVLGLQPRQIAIWFQNRRARWKTKQLEKEFEILKKQFELAKADNDALMAQNQKLHAELQSLKSRDYCETIKLKKETEGSWSNGSNSSSDINLDLSRMPIIKGPVSSQNGISLQSTSLKPTSIPQFLPHSPRPELQQEGFCNMFHLIDEHQNFWPWHEQNHFR